ncbi:MAG TPA: protoporphyrinogen oxidase [Candidatus Binatia bacterium]
MSSRIVVIGGGITGLAAANRILEVKRASNLDIEPLLLEASPRLGGTVGTERLDGFLIEAGPDSFITEKPAALRLCERLGLMPRLISTQAANQKIYVVQRGRLVPLPDGFFLLAPTRVWPFIKTPLFSPTGKLRIAGELVLPRGEDHGDESLGAFVRRRFGTEALERVAQPLVGGIYAADPDLLSLTATMPRFREMELKRRSVILAMWKEQRKRLHTAAGGSGARWSLFVTLAGGMQELVDSIANRLPEGSVRLNSPVREISHSASDDNWHLTIAAKEVITARALVLATPAFRAASILSVIAPAAADELSRIQYASTATVSLGFRTGDFSRALNGFGFVVPAVEGRKIMACTFSSLKYPGRAPEGHVLLRAFVGGSLQPELFEDDDTTMEKNVRTELRELVGVTAPPLFTRIRRHPDSMPQYHVGHGDRIARIETAIIRFPGVALAGSAYHGVGISDCIRTGEAAAEKVIEYVRSIDAAWRA